MASANLLNGGVDEVFLRADSSGAQSLLRGGAGSTLALADSTGTIQTSYSYDPFGNTSVSGAASNHSGQYTGRENDQTGLYYYRARYYSPTLQRFISEDPVGLLGGVNLYAYVGNNPVSRRDPSGLMEVEDVLAPLSDVSAGFSDTITGGLTKWIRGFTPGRKAADEGSWAYFGGHLGGEVWLILMTEGGGGVSAEAEEALEAEAEATEGGTALFRGVGEEHPGYPDALEGNAYPRGGHSDPYLHNLGDTRSEFTSWTTERSVAEDFAGENGVVLEKEFSPSEMIRSPDRFGENEVLIRGPVTGARVTPP